MKTIFFIARYGKLISNILRTDLLPTLKKEDVRIVLFSPVIDGEFACQEFADDKVTLEKSLESVDKEGYEHRAKTHRLGWLERSLMVFREGLFARTSSSATKRYHYERYRGEALLSPSKLLRLLLFSLGYWMATLEKRLSVGARGLREFSKKLDATLFSSGSWDVLFEKYRPHLVFSIHSHFGDADVPFLRAAIRHKVPSVVLIQSWDNLATKGELAVKIDKLVVWNEIMRKEAVELHSYPPEDIYISGSPQFDLYFGHREHLSSREEFFDRIGADINKKLLTCTLFFSWLAPFEWQIVDILGKSIEEDRFVYPCQLLVRPRREEYAYELCRRFKNRKDIIVDLSPLDWDFRDAEMKEAFHLGDTLCHSDVVINISSTTSIESCIFDTPVVNIAFDGYETKSRWESIARYYNYDHYKRIAPTLGVRIARSKEDLVEYVNNYLQDPQLDSEGRKKIVAEQCYYTDGKSGERVAKYILDFLHRQG